MSKRLPPCPELPRRARLEAKSNSFAELDKIATAQIARFGLSPNAITLLKKSGLQGELPFVRRSVYVAGITAWERASYWSSNKETIRKSLAKKHALLGQIRADAQELAAIVQRGRAKTDARRLYDPTLLMKQMRDEIVFEKLEEAAELIEHTFPGLDYVSDHWDKLDIGKREPLTEFFIENLAALWQTLFGRQPPTARTGAFVEFANAGWSLLGWDEYSGRSGLGKAIFTKATAEDWSLLKLAFQPRTGTRTAK
ncbi:hypothetical protein [Bradyrhizobium sp. 164]|uniref:hypothetical protein n=1 Tax=Bradyrhizobium sp. 164 TaxID=2782637 RepID=UPI001FF8E4CC|nr:hypothetical protein [Bradyrhizobium sp. 164]MCK1595577.1 hypothetical protein [Bradyrhizobium sp. 164]